MNKRDTRTTILKAAGKAFSKQGFDGASISSIAKIAGINQSLIYHHFKCKEDLWKQVKIDILHEEFGGETPAELFRTDNFKNFITDFIEKRYDFYLHQPKVRRMVLWQELESKGHAKELHDEEKQACIYAWCKAFQQFQENGEVRPDIDPELAIFTIATLTRTILNDHFFFHSKKDISQHHDAQKKLIFDILWRSLSSQS